MAEAETSARQALALYEESIPTDWQTFKCRTMLGGILNGEKKRPEAELALRNAAALARELSGDEQQENLAQVLYDLAWVLQIEDKLPEAETAARDALAIRKSLEAAGHPQHQGVADSLYELAVVLESEHESGQAEAAARECLAFFEKTIPNEWPTYNCRSTLGLILTSERKYAEAEPLLLSAYEGLSQTQGTFSTDLKARVRESLERLVQLYQAIPRPDQAAQWQRRLTEFDSVAAESRVRLVAPNAEAVAASRTTATQP